MAENKVVALNLGPVTSYGLAKSKGFPGTEEAWVEKMMATATDDDVDALDEKIDDLDTKVDTQVETINATIEQEVGAVDTKADGIAANLTTLSGVVAQKMDTTVAQASFVPVPSASGAQGDALRNNGDGTTAWAPIGLPTDEQTGTAINAWLTAHPEATTTVQDGAITRAKLITDLQEKTDLVQNATAPAFDATGAYAVGAHVTYGGKLYVLPSGHEANVTWADTTKTEVNFGGEVTDLKSVITNVNNAVVDGGNLKKTFNWQYGSINSSGVETGNTTKYYARTTEFYAPESSTIVVNLSEGTTYFVKVGYNADGSFASGSRQTISAQSTLTVELDTTLKYRFVIMMTSGSYDLGHMDDYLTISVPTKIAENTANISANKDILDVMKQPLPITWDIGYEYSGATGAKTVSTSMAAGSLIYCANGGRIYNNSDAKDGNNKTLIGRISKYSGGVYKGEVAFNAGSVYTIEEGVTSIGINIGRYSTAGVDFAESDLSYFSFAGYINPPIHVADPYLALPSRQITKYRYIWHDNFHRANDSTGLGTNGDTEYPMTYEYAGAQLAISGNACVNTQAAKGIAYADMGYSDCVIEYQADLSDVELTTRGYGICFRRTDNNNFFSCQLRKENIKINKIENGTNTEIGNIGVTSANKAPKKISVELEGSKIRIYTNGVMVRELTDSFNQTATIHGIFLDNYTSGNNGKILNFGVKIKDTWHPMVDQMDSGTLPYNIVVENPGYDYNFGFLYNTVCNSNTSLRFENRVVDNMSVANKRSEIAIKGYGRMLDEQMYEWDMMLGDDYAVIDPMAEIIMQMHDISDYGQTEVGTSPSFEIHVKDGHYFVHRQYSEYKTFYDTSHITVQNTDIGSYLDDVGRWVHWTFHIKWAYNDFFEPFIYLYKNGELVYKSVLPNVINAAHVPYFKIGIYTFNWVEHPDQTVATVRTMYVDNIRPSY